MWIIFNPAAGAARRLDRALALLPGAQIHRTAGPGDARRIAAEGIARGASIIVAAGGDGTIAEVTEALLAAAGPSVPCLGILPLGSANVLARELDLPLRPEAAARVLLAGRRAMLRPGIATAPGKAPRLFVQMLGAGFDAAVVHALPNRLKRRLGRFAYVVQTLRSLPGHAYPPLRFRADGGPWEEAAGLLVMNGRLYAGPYLVAPGASPTQPGFTLIAQRRAGAGRTLLAGLALPLDLLHHLPFMTLHECERVEIEGAGVPVQADGDAAGFLPLRVESAPAGIPVLVPSGMPPAVLAVPAPAAARGVVEAVR